MNDKLSACFTIAAQYLRLATSDFLHKGYFKFGEDFIKLDIKQSG